MFKFIIKNHKVSAIEVNRRRVDPKQLQGSDMWDKYNNVVYWLGTKRNGISKITGDRFEYYPYRFYDSNTIIDNEVYNDYCKRYKNSLKL